VLFTGNVTETAIPGRSDLILLSSSCLAGKPAHHLDGLVFMSVDEDNRDRNTGFLSGYATRDVTGGIFWRPGYGSIRREALRAQGVFCLHQTGR
jgi:hypothetical protein